MTVIPFGNNSYQGLSTDTKPTNIPDNSTFYEIDTFNSFLRISGSWVEVSSRMPCDYLVYKSGSTIKGIIGTTRQVKSTSTVSVDVVVNDILSNLLPTTGGFIEFSVDTFSIANPIVIPSNAAAGLNSNYFFRGVIS